MISEGSFDTEDWRNYAKQMLCHHRNKMHFKIYVFYCNFNHFIH